MGTDQYGSGYNSGYGADYVGYPLIFRNMGNFEDVSKEAHDSYSVYVNKDYVGSKVLVSQVEKIDDVRKYLINEGFSDFSTRLEGKEYFIGVDGGEALDIKNTMNVYLNNR
jgi:hypothetical protein